MNPRILNALVLSALFLPAAVVRAENMVYPPKTIPSVNEFGIQAGTDITEKLNDLLKSPECPGGLYFPNGTYYIHDTIFYPQLNTRNQRRYGGIRFYGQSEAKTIIRLKSGSFTDPKHRKAMMDYDHPKSSDLFDSAINHLSFVIESNNPGADGVNFFSNNMGWMEAVTITCLDPANQGIGLNPGYAGINGPFTINNVSVNGFAIGVHTVGWVDGGTFVHIKVRGQNGKDVINEEGKTFHASCGFFNNTNGIALRDLRSENTVPALCNGGFMVLLDSVLKTPARTKSENPAVQNEFLGFGDFGNGVLFVRNLTTEGYAASLTDRSRASKTHLTTKKIDEYVINSPNSTAFPNDTRSLNLPILEPPAVPEEPVSAWVNVADFRKDSDGEDWGPAFQRAIDSGATTLYAVGSMKIGTTVHIRGRVRHITGLKSNWLAGTLDAPGYDLNSKGGPVFVFDTSNPKVVLFEQFSIGFSFGKAWMFEDRSKNTVVIKHTNGEFRNTAGCGPASFEDNSMTLKLDYPQNVWATGLNTEFKDTLISNHGGALSVVGFKMEGVGTVLETLDGGRSEMLGGLLYIIGKTPTDRPLMRTVNASASMAGLSEVTFGGETHNVRIEETRNGETKKALRSEFGGSIGLYLTIPPRKTSAMHRPNVSL